MDYNIGVNKNDKYLYYIAKIVFENYKGREIVTWISNDKFENILWKCFNIKVSFSVSQRKDTCDGKRIKSFDIIKNNRDKYYLVCIDRQYEESLENELNSYGYYDIKDFVFVRHKPIVLNNLSCNTNYADVYGNTIKIESTDKKLGHIIFRGGNNEILIGSNVKGTERCTFDISSNFSFWMGSGCCISDALKVDCFGSKGSAFIKIYDNCKFSNALFRVYVSPKESGICIGEGTSAECNFEVHANDGKRVIAGRDCMFSHNVSLWSGDGHPVFDTETGQIINSNYDRKNNKNKIFIGDHVWVGYGAFLLNGANIGTGCIIGAESVVKHAYDNNCAIGGNPSKQIRTNCTWHRDMYCDNIEALPQKYRNQTNNAKPAISGLNVLVVGGTGFSGIQLVKRLIALGNTVTIATRGRKQDSFGSSVNRIVLDVTDERSVKTALEGKEFDVVFDDLAYNPVNCSNILKYVKTPKYVQLSSVMAYGHFHLELKEDEIDLSKDDRWIKWENNDVEKLNKQEIYVVGKRYAEIAAYKYAVDKKIITVRLPYVFDNRLEYYCNHIINCLPMNIKDINKEIVFVRDSDVGEFLPWIAAQEFSGPINLSCTGRVSIKAIISYIEKKTDKKAIISKSGDAEPFNLFGETSYSLDLSNINKLHYCVPDINDWIWGSIDWLITKRTTSKNIVNSSMVSERLNKQKNLSFTNAHEWPFYTHTIMALDYANCTSCEACSNICPRKAIKFENNKEGFRIPVIDSDLCIRCGICKKTCPQLNFKIKNSVEKNCVAFMAKDDVRRESASGGAFYAMAEYVLEKNGFVCGAAYDIDFNLRHIIIHDKQDLSRIQGSKYLQSAIGTIYQDIKMLLDNGSLVLFVGTPCQVDGLNHYLKNDYANLYTVDLFCRGVPSAFVFDKYLESVGKGNVERIIQKSKRPNGWGAYTEIGYKTGSTEFYSMENNMYMKAFLSDIMFKESCYSCNYAQEARVGDLSIGDFWNVGKYNVEYDDRLGTSIVIASSDKGKRLLSSINSKMVANVPLMFEKPYNSALCASRKCPQNRGLFFDMLINKRVPFGAALDRALYGKKYDIGIVGWWSNLNYGGTLTYYALYSAIQKLGYSVLMIRPPRSDAKIPPENTVPMRFAKKHYKISRIYADRDMHLLNYACKGFVSGSDQLWSPWLEQYAGPSCFLSFANKNSLRVSYGSSFGNSEDLPQSFVDRYRGEIDKFDAVSVREDYGLNICDKYFDKKANFVCDPVFLCKTEEYVELAKQSTCKFPHSFILNFILDPDEEKNEASDFVARKYNAKSVCFTDLQNSEEKATKFGSSIVYAQHPIEDLLKAYSECKFVITDSFHGTCLAIIFNKPFISIANKNRGERRFKSLLKWVGLSEQLVNSPMDILENHRLCEPINYAMINKNVENFANQSFRWLADALKKMKY